MVIMLNTVPTLLPSAEFSFNLPADTCRVHEYISLILVRFSSTEIIFLVTDS